MMRPSLLFPLLLLTSAAVAEPMPLSLALEALDGTVAACSAKGYKVAVAIVDPDGVIQLQARGDGSPIHSQRFSFRKAYTIASMGPMFGVETGSALVAHLRDFPGGLANVQSGSTDLLFLPGSAVIRSAGVPVGAIGVSGAPQSSEDESCALAGLARIQARLDAKR